MLYLFLILSANAIIIGIASLMKLCGALDISWLRATLTSPFLTVAVIAVDGIFAFIIRRLPEKWFSVESPLSSVSKRESEIYRRLGVRRWRERIPELGIFTGFHKDHIYEPTNNEYLRRFVLEANYGAMIHLVCVPVGFLIIFLTPPDLALNFAIPVAVVNAVLNLMPTFTLRYNVPKLISLMKLNERRAKKAAQSTAASDEPK